jgi:hypothetical protein
MQAIPGYRKGIIYTTGATNMTLEQAKAIIKELGGRPCEGAWWEDTENIYASSVERDRRCYNHPIYEVYFSKASGWLSVTGRKHPKSEVAA